MQNSFPQTRSQSPRISGRFSVLQYLVVSLSTNIVHKREKTTNRVCKVIQQGKDPNLRPCRFV